MVSRQTVLESNEHASSISGLVCVFVGGTGGIGESTVREVFLKTKAPRAYILGRSVQKGKQLCSELMLSNPGSRATFLETDVSLLKNVDDVCAKMQHLEKEINVLFLTAGYMTLKGRNETSEGIDHKMSVNYYSRMRFIFNLMPQVMAAGRGGEISRVLSVLAAGSEGDVNMNDLDLKHNFTLMACLSHCVVMTDFMMEELAKRYPDTVFMHSYPGTIKTGIANQLTGPVRLAVKVFYAVMTPWILNVGESGKRHLFQITSAVYPSGNGGAGGIAVPEGMEVMNGSNGVKGSGAYLLDWDGKPTGDVSRLRKFRDEGAPAIIWDHTTTMLSRCSQSKRAASSEAEGSGRPPPVAPNLVNWRAG